MKLLLLIACALFSGRAFALDAGFDLPAEYAKRVSDGIERYRKSGATITVMDTKGRPVARAAVEIRQLSHDFLFGCAFPSWDLSRNQPGPEIWPRFERYFLSLFNYATTENMLKWPSLERVEGQPDYRMTDAFVEWCHKHGITIKGHNLVWGIEPGGHPRWLEKYSPDEVAEKVKRRITEVMTRYQGKIDIWDVVNEPLDCHWFETHMSANYCAESLKWARAANPKATLIVNEYGCHFGKAEKFVNYCRDLLRQGAPLDAVGEQAHDPPRIPSPKQVFDTLDKLASLGKDIHLTEITFPSNGAEIKSDFVQGTWTPEIQGKYYRYYYTLAFSHPRVKAITMWAMWDGSSWLDQGGIIARDWTPKPAYHELDSLINREWRTNLSGTTASDGTFRFRGFHGTYEVRITVGGRTTTASLHVSEGGPNTLDVRLGP